MFINSISTDANVKEMKHALDNTAIINKFPSLEIAEMIITATNRIEAIIPEAFNNPLSNAVPHFLYNSLFLFLNSSNPSAITLEKNSYL